MRLPMSLSEADLAEQINRQVQAVLRAPTVPSAATELTIASSIDHTLLKAEATPAQIDQLCAEAYQYGFASVCVNPSYVPLCTQLLAGSGVAVCTVVGFPLGAISSN